MKRGSRKFVTPIIHRWMPTVTFVTRQNFSIYFQLTRLGKDFLSSTTSQLHKRRRIRENATLLVFCLLLSWLNDMIIWASTRNHFIISFLNAKTRIPTCLVFRLDASQQNSLCGDERVNLDDTNEYIARKITSKTFSLFFFSDCLRLCCERKVSARKFHAHVHSRTFQ